MIINDENDTKKRRSTTLSAFFIKIFLRIINEHQLNQTYR